MTDFALRAQSWLVHSLAASGLLLLLAAVMVLLVRQPARRRQIGSWSIRAALLLPLLALLPSWLIVPLPSPQAQTNIAAPTVVEGEKPQPPAEVPSDLVYTLRSLSQQRRPQRSLPGRRRLWHQSLQRFRTGPCCRSSRSR